MSVPVGYNPNISLLAPGSGAIHSMSGGNMLPPSEYNYSQTLLPAVGGEILSYRGGETLQKSVAETAETAEPILIAPSSNKNKSIIIFGKSYMIPNPKSIHDKITNETHLEILKQVGLDGDGVTTKQKKDILQAFYDDTCNTDMPLSAKSTCGPVREIIQSLALKLISTLNIGAAEKIDNSTIQFKKEENGSIHLSITFNFDELSKLSAAVTAVTNENNASVTAVANENNASVTANENNASVVANENNASVVADINVNKRKPLLSDENRQKINNESGNTGTYSPPNIAERNTNNKRKPLLSDENRQKINNESENTGTYSPPTVIGGITVKKHKSISNKRKITKRKTFKKHLKKRRSEKNTNK